MHSCCLRQSSVLCLDPTCPATSASTTATSATAFSTHPTSTTTWWWWSLPIFFQPVEDPSKWWYLGHADVEPLGSSFLHEKKFPSEHSIEICTPTVQDEVLELEELIVELLSPDLRRVQDPNVHQQAVLQRQDGGLNKDNEISHLFRSLRRTAKLNAVPKPHRFLIIQRLKASCQTLRGKPQVIDGMDSWHLLEEVIFHRIILNWF